MRQFLFFSLFFLVTISLVGQTIPPGTTYQAVARDAKGDLITNQTIEAKIMLLANSPTGSVIYAEKHQINTDEQGLFSVVIGDGQITQGNYANISWKSDQIWLEMAIRENKEADFVSLGASPLLEVPYGFGNKPGDGQVGPEKFTGPYWKTNGNAGVAAQFQFLGTVDNNDLVIKTNNMERMRVAADGSVNILEDLELDGSLDIQDNLLVGNDLTVNGLSYLNDNTLIDGNLTVLGDAILNNIISTGPTSFSQLSVVGPGAFTPGEHVAEFVNSSGGNGDGILIKIDKPKTSRSNNYITFMDGSNNTTGRIEGFSLDSGDTFSDFPSKSFSQFFDILGEFGPIFSPGSFPIYDLVGGELPDADYDRGQLPSINFASAFFDKGQLSDLDFSSGSFPNFNTITSGISPNFDFTSFFNPDPLVDAGLALQDIICWAIDNGLESLVTTNPFDIALAAVVIAETQICNDGGIIFGSQGADYAEWLEKRNPQEKFSYGQIVGVHGGKISKVTEGADQIMSISMAPIVLGNMPEDGQEHLYEKVGFMGQVPVLVRGTVNVGDYIVASGNNDGFGKAIAPEDIRLEHMTQVLGKAWEGASQDRINMVNVSVGVKTNEWASVFQQQHDQIEAQQQQIEQLKVELEQFQQLEQRLNKLEALIQKSEASIK